MRPYASSAWVPPGLVVRNRCAFARASERKRRSPPEVHFFEVFCGSACGQASMQNSRRACRRLFLNTRRRKLSRRSAPGGRCVREAVDAHPALVSAATAPRTARLAFEKERVMAIVLFLPADAPRTHAPVHR